MLPSGSIFDVGGDFWTTENPDVRVRGPIREWPKSYILPSIILSLACGGLLFWHVKDPARQIDAWAVTLLVVGFLPWLRKVDNVSSGPRARSRPNPFSP